MSVLRRIFKGVLSLLLLAVVILSFMARRDRKATEVETRRANAASKFAEVDGLRIHYRDRGEGSPLVLLHGSNSSLQTWEGWVSALSADHRVITLDLPGHGLTGPDAKQRYSAAQMAEVVDLFVGKLGVARFALAGNSMGGNVAWHYTLAHPDKVERLILVDSAGYPREEPRPFALRAMSSSLFGVVAQHVTPRFMIARSVKDTYGDPSKVTDARVDEYEDQLLREGNREATRIRLSSAADDGQQSRLAEIKVPTLILWGALDRWILPKYGERFAKDIPGSTLVMLPGLGHIPMEEDPAATASAVRAWWK
jgi:pimeloyl-ACP methyl ester carboxylesterase